VGLNGDRHAYESFLKELHVHLEKYVDMGHKTEQTLPGLSVVAFLSMGHYPCYTSPDFSIIKSSQYFFSLQGFSRGIYPKVLMFMCARFGFLYCFLYLYLS